MNPKKRNYTSDAELNHIIKYQEHMHLRFGSEAEEPFVLDGWKQMEP